MLVGIVYQHPSFSTVPESIMVTKLQKKSSNTGPLPLTGSVKDSAQQIWQAGLGAFSKAQAEGTKAIEALIKEGVNMQRRTQSVAEEKMSEASNKMSSMATDISSKASGQWDKLESIFEDRVAKALNKLGVPSAKDVNALIARIDELNKSVQKLSAKNVTTKTTVKAAARPASAKTVKPTTKAVAKPTGKRPAARKADPSGKSV
jgi:poly(hydroxyalkanoate) granule-associated protein